jgi:restriction system protein
MEWEDFEHLVRELFQKEFAQTGGEVRVTQASRDRGVDAIAFDPDPIRGGKFVIQAKRYNMVVSVSAVRDLYGTMIAEGATKGILVTTSYFGRDSREFAKDKPITLIDGENLVHMFQKHGYNVHIAMLPKGDPRRGLRDGDASR